MNFDFMNQFDWSQNHKATGTKIGIRITKTFRKVPFSFKADKTLVIRVFNGATLIKERELSTQEVKAFWLKLPLAPSYDECKKSIKYKVLEVRTSEYILEIFDGNGEPCPTSMVCHKDGRQYMNWNGEGQKPSYDCGRSTLED